MSDLMKQFLTAWLDWAENDGRSGEFDPQFGLCYNYSQFCGGYNNNAYAELAKMFKADGLDDAYPFDENSDSYEQDAIFSTIHQNPKRIAWVRSKLEPSFSLDGVLSELEAGAKLQPVVDWGNPLGQEFGA